MRVPSLPEELFTKRWMADFEGASSVGAVQVGSEKHFKLLCEHPALLSKLQELSIAIECGTMEKKYQRDLIHNLTSSAFLLSIPQIRKLSLTLSIRFPMPCLV